jgi:hypothetical protein
MRTNRLSRARQMFLRFELVLTISIMSEGHDKLFGSLPCDLDDFGRDDPFVAGTDRRAGCQLEESSLECGFLNSFSHLDSAVP